MPLPASPCRAPRLAPLVLAAAGVLLVPTPARALKVGQPAPAFSAAESHSKTVRLADLRGKYVVLEWHNPQCPFVKKFYDSGTMQALQRRWTGRGVMWWAVLSSAPGKQGALDASAINGAMAAAHAAPSGVLLDAEGALGRLYGAKTTPHMFVIDPTGRLIYEGAIDDHPDADADSLAGARNYVSEALEASMAGRPVAVATTPPYGCGVKY